MRWVDMAEYLDAVLTEALLDTVNDLWTDISAYVVTDIEGEYGLPGVAPIDRTADTGYIKFSLDNSTDLFTPQLTTTLGGKDGGFAKGTKIRQTCSYQGEPWVTFYGTIDNIEIDSKDYGERRVIVTCLDWMNSASTFPMKQTAILTNTTCDEGIAAIVARMPTAPLETTYHAGLDLFPTVFDSTTRNAKAITEFQKLAMSELSYTYLVRGRTTGERLVVESRETRNTSVLQKIPLLRTLSGFHKLIDGGVASPGPYTGGYRLLMDGGRKILHQVTSFSFDNNMLDLLVVNGENVINDVTVKVYPRKVDAGLTVLFTLQKAQTIPAGDTITLRGGYIDATTKKTCNATGFTDVATNVSYTLSAGAVSIVADFGSEAFSLDITNAGAALDLLTLTISGKAVHLDEPIESSVTDTVSVAQNDYRTAVLDQPYQDDLHDGVVLAYITIYRNAKTKTLAKRVIMLANQDQSSMIAFLALDIGALISIRETRSEVNASYYIVRKGYTISVSGIVNYWFDVQDALSYAAYFWQVGPAAPNNRSIVGSLVVGV